MAKVAHRVEISVRESQIAKLRGVITKSLIRKACNETLNILFSDLITELSVLITDDLEIAELNKRFRSKEEATDVLSFPQKHEPKDANLRLLGDIVISLDTIIKNSKDDKKEVIEEFLEILIHGILHLAGYEHEKVSDELKREMFSKQKEIYLSLLQQFKISGSSKLIVDMD